MIDFTAVSTEFRSLVARRRELLTFLGSTFAALSIFLQNVLQGNLPDSLKAELQDHLFAFYAIMLMVPSLLLALRNAKMHSGMVLNGMLYARLMQHQDFTPRKGDPRKAAVHNFLGVSFLIFILGNILGGFSAVILALSINIDVLWALLIGVAVVLIWVLLYFRFHAQAVKIAFQRIDSEECSQFDINEWQGHVTGSLEDTNQDMLTMIAFVGLVVFSVFESISGLGIQPDPVGVGRQAISEFAPADVNTYGPVIFSSLMMITCVLSLLTYLRLRIALGNFSLQIDENDRPFRPFRLTDSFLGYALLAFLFAVSIYVFLSLVPGMTTNTILLICTLLFILTLIVEKLVLLYMDRKK